MKHLHREDLLLSALAAAATLGALLLANPPADAISVPMEDEPGWSCRYDGNRVCGPTNDMGEQAGCYDDVGALVAPWPCHIVVNPDGTSDVYSGYEQGR